MKHDLSPSPVTELELRRELGIPADAAQVLVFTESSHWDPNWLHTSEEYYQLRIRHILDAAIAALQAEPRRIFSLESLYFLMLYWDRRPDMRNVVRDLINSGRLRLTGSGVTTPDTVLPDTEALVRDYLYGQEWLRENGMTQEPRVAYLPDDFGYSPALPSVLTALGYDQTCITRIDGMYFVATDLRPKSAYPLAGSSAELLTRVHKSADFVWRAADDTELLCHWNAHTYFQGDMLAHVGIIRWMGQTWGLPWRTDHHIRRRISHYVGQLKPLARTPYLLCPIGCDFNDPIRDLITLLDRYNRRFFADTGIWTLCAGLDDYLGLVDCRRASLPVLELDPNPYWMGFYTSRPEAKRRTNRIVRKLLLAEKLSSLPDLPHQPNGDLRAAWDGIVLSNHHDFITGTSPDRIWRDEQRPCLERAEELADDVLRAAASQCPPITPRPQPQPPWWRREPGRCLVVSEQYRLVIDLERGGCITSLTHGPGAPELLTGPANDVVGYFDSGGLWRLGHEFRGGTFREVARISDSVATIATREVEGFLEIRVECVFLGHRFIRWLWLHSTSPLIRMRLSGTASRNHSITCLFPTTVRADSLTMDVPGGVVDRPSHKLYEPTFWPARSFVHIHEELSGRGLAFFLGGPASAGLHNRGVVELFALRHATRERAFGIVPILAHPAAGTDPDEHNFDYSLLATTAGDYHDNALPQMVRRALRRVGDTATDESLDRGGESAALLDHEDAMLLALKRADRGAGWIARISRVGEHYAVTRLSLPGRTIRSATLCDARERDREPLRVEDGAVVVPLAHHLTSVRLEVWFSKYQLP